MNLLQIIDNSASLIKPLTEAKSEASLEALIEKNSHIILGINFLIIGRQVKTDSGKILDLLAIDRQGRLVVIELKKGYAPRDMIAQILDYSSWLSTLSERRIEDIAKAHFIKNNQDYSSLSEAFSKHYGFEEYPEFGNDVVNVLFAKEFSEEVINPAKYLSSFNIPIYCIKFEIFENNREQFIVTNNITDPSEEFYQQEDTENYENKLLIKQLSKYLQEKYSNNASGMRFEIIENFKVHQTKRGQWSFVNTKWVYDDGTKFCIEIGIRSLREKSNLYSYFGNYQQSIKLYEKINNISASEEYLSSYNNNSKNSKTMYIRHKDDEKININKLKEFSDNEIPNLLNLVEQL